METRWLLLPGQTLNNTKISDRLTELHIGNKKWQHLIGHLKEKDNLQTELTLQKKNVENKKKELEELEKGWGGTVLVRSFLKQVEF